MSALRIQEDAMEELILVNNQEYTIEKLLGKGKGGYSYLAHRPDGSAVVVKQIHHEPCGYYQFGDKLASELADYEKLTAIGIPLPRLLDVDQDDERIIKEYIPGETIYEMVLHDRLDPACLVQMKEMCRLLYAVHTNIDYFPTNFILHDGVLHYVDYECNDYMEEWNFENWGVKYWSKTPEFLQYAKEHP